MNLPSGTVTFLFTDIEASAKLWEEHPEQMRLSLARHDEILRNAIEVNGGYVFKTIGDAFCAAFHTGAEALTTVLATQIAIYKESWPDPINLRVRMALHSGAAESRDNDYFGQPLNRVARLLSLAHGGQVLLSGVTHDLCRDSLPAGSSQKSLGEHRLKDLGRPESVFQLCHPDLPAEFPPLRSLESMLNNLPQQVTSFVGREKEVAEVKAMLEKTRLLTLTGSGGTGKTRLAMQSAAEMLDGSGDGAWLVELAALSDPSLVPQTVASVFGLREEPGKPILQTVTEHLKNKFLLLVLDNCEHVLNSCASLADAILRQCPKVLILATSREGLGIAGETTYRVPSLSLPDPKQPQTPESLSHFEAALLFIERAVQVQTGFTVTNRNAPALASICYRLDGIPLAIELAAARVRSLTVEDINGKLDQRFRLLTGGSRTALPRQQTLRSLIDWSYDLLSETEKALLCRLSVFTGGWPLDAAEKVCKGELVEEWEMLDLLTSLSDKSLVAVETCGSSVRYRLLETVRQYARDRLLESGDGEQWRNRHLTHFLTLAEEAEPHLTGPIQQTWLERLETEHDNLRAALEWGGNDPASAGLRLSGALWRFWHVRGHLSEGRERLSRALDLGRSCTAEALAKALNGAGILARIQGDYPAARALHEESLGIYRELGDRLGIADSLNNLGNVSYGQGDYPAARALHEESLGIRRELGDRRGIAASLNNLGNVSKVQGDYPAARALYEESLGITRELSDWRFIADLLENLGKVSHDQGDYLAARALYKESLGIYRELGNRSGIAESLEAFAELAVVERTPLHTPRLLGAAERLREEIGLPLPLDERPRYERHVAAARAAQADDAAFDDAWQQGRVMTVKEACTLALEQTHE